MSEIRGLVAHLAADVVGPIPMARDLVAKLPDVGVGKLSLDVGAALDLELLVRGKPHPDEQAMIDRVRRAMESYARRCQLPGPDLEALHEAMRTATPRGMECTTGGVN
jgi:hypothetical protein